VKRWPEGNSPGKKTDAIVALQRRLLCEAPGERITAYQLCMDLQELDKTQPMPCKLWSIPTKLPAGPPPRRMVLPAAAADIAGQNGYAKGAAVLVYVDEKWREGIVEHVSTTLCPGAVQVRYKAADGEKPILICPWKFAALLRPKLLMRVASKQSAVTNSGEGQAALRSSSKTASSKPSRKSPTSVTMKRCRPPGCSIQ